MGLLNLTRAQREVERQRQLRLIEATERTLQRRMRALLNRTALDASRMIEGGGPQAANRAMIGFQEEVTRLLASVLRPIMQRFGRDTLDAFQEAKSARAWETKQDEFEGQVDRWLEAHVFRASAEITGTESGLLRAAISNAVTEGLSQAATAVAVKKSLQGVSRSQAARIARTEVHTSAMAASTATVETLGEDTVKVWVNAGDDRVRNLSDGDQFSHRAINGQKRPSDQPFDVPGEAGTEQLMFPGDPSGSPGNVINCRCVQTWELVD